MAETKVTGVYKPDAGMKAIKIASRPKEVMGFDEDRLPYYYPHFDANTKQMPEIKEWKVGNKYKLVIEIEEKHMSEGRGNGISAGFDIVSYKVLNTKKK